MPVDKFGLMENETTTTIQPLRNYAVNLDDLENVEGFNKSGKKDQLYCFKLNENHIYVRTEIPPGLQDALGRTKNKPLTFVFDEDNKLIAIPVKYEWDIDIQLNNNTYSRANKKISITNSGNIIGTLVSVPPREMIDDPILLIRNKTRYCLASRKSKEAHFEFQPENKNAGAILTNPPVGSTIIIEGIINNESEEKKEILPGLVMTAMIGLSGQYDFKFILMKENDTTYVIKFATLGIILAQVSTIALNPVKIHDFYSICRVRLTTQPVNDYEIKFC